MLSWRETELTWTSSPNYTQRYIGSRYMYMYIVHCISVHCICTVRTAYYLHVHCMYNVQSCYMYMQLLVEQGKKDEALAVLVQYRRRHPDRINPTRSCSYRLSPLTTKCLHLSSIRLYNAVCIIQCSRLLCGFLLISCFPIPAGMCVIV